MKTIYSRAKDLRICSNNPPAQILNSVKQGASEAALLHLPKPSSFKRALNKAKKIENPTPTAPGTLADLQLDPSAIESLNGESMLVYDNEGTERRVVILATETNLLLLQRSPSWYVDATFRVCPQLFYQLLVIHAEIPNHQGGAPWVFPCVYMLLTSKDTDIYLEGFTFLKSLYDFAPQTIMVDFEMALRNSLSQVFPSAVVDGCYFHFCQAVLRWVRENGLKKSYDDGINNPLTNSWTPGPVRVWIRRLMQLAFLPVDDVVPSFIELLDLIPADLGLDDFLNYFMTTWVQGVSTARSTKPARFPPQSWNLVERTNCNLNKTNNYAEAFNRKFAAMVGHAHPTIWNFLQAVYVEQSTTDELILKESYGDAPAAKRARQITKDRRLAHLVEAYDDQDLVSHLDMLRNVMAED